jgi:uncharacterized membrane protein
MMKRLFLVLLLVSLVVAKSYYTIPAVKVDYYLNSDGTVNVAEDITYDLSGSFTEMYVQLPPDLQISNASGYCLQKNCEFYTQMNGGWRELVLRSSYSNERVDAVFIYTVNGEVLAQKDSAQFFYKLWGDQWEKSPGTLDATVHLPGDVSQTTYFVHPPGLNYQNKSGGQAIEIISANHPARTYLETNIIMPSSWFSGLPKATKYMSKQEIIDGEKAYAQNEAFIRMGQLAFMIIVIAALPLAFVLVYLKYGKEKPLSELNYLAEY